MAALNGSLFCFFGNFAKFVETKHKAMIQANELRLGNLLLNAGGKVVPTTAQTISDLELKLIVRKHIPLTEEWLLKAGFEQDGACYIKDLFGSTFIELDCDGELYNLFIRQLGEFGEGDCILMSITIEHVHQLQNLYFALTGKELEFKL